ncbi:hypothetical protein C2E23DRAFT_841980 [Lenzites betulinus]|nr:hypothetical protein C2E23DRAFT_841980 [Lenzites betulinus]
MLDDALNSPSFYQSLRQTVADLAMTPCKLELDVLPLDSVDMYGEPDRNSAYSLAGHVEVKLTPPTSLLYDPPASEERLVLESLVLTFEGQSELLSPETGYGACRIVEFSQELLQNGPVEVGHYWDENLRDPQRWLVTFNLAVPGWLPPSCYTTFVDPSRREPEVSYRLSAKATYRDMRPGSSKSLRSLCYGYSKLPSTQTTTSPLAAVKINRFTIPPPSHALATSEFTQFPFHSVEYAGSVKGSSKIPAEVLSKLRVLAYLPEHIPTDSDSFPLFIRLRPENLTKDERKRLLLPKLSVSASQTEVLRSSLSKKYAEKWPVPAPCEQHPRRPVQTRRRDVRDYECALMLTTSPNATSHSTRSILPQEYPEYFDLCGSGDGFAAAAFDDPTSWIQMRLDVPFCHVLSDKKDRHEAAPVQTLRPTESGPLLSVFHTLDVALTCTYDLSAGEEANVATEELRLSLPLSFVRLPRANARLSLDDSLLAAVPIPSYADASAECGAINMREAAFQPASLPYAQALPPYNQLFHPNGMLREDPTPLPRYTRDPKDAEDPPPPPVVCKQTPPTKLSIPASSELASSA